MVVPPNGCKAFDELRVDIGHEASLGLKCEEHRAGAKKRFDVSSIESTQIRGKATG
jgi:hypothetical protein